MIFDNAIDPASNVQGEFSYKEYSFVRPDNTKAYYNKAKYVINSDVFTEVFPAQPDVIYLPALIIEVDTTSEVGFQFGGTHDTQPSIKISLVGDNQAQIEAIACVISSQSTRSFPIVAANNGPKFNYFYDLTENYAYCPWFSSSSNFGYIKSVKYNRNFDFKTEKADPSLYGGNVIIDISAIR